MSRGVRQRDARGARSWCAALLAAGTLLAAAPALAAHPLEGDAEEQALLAALRKEKYIRARERAEALLRRRPDSLIARFVLAEAFFEEEANLPRALHHLQLAERQLRARYGERPRDPLAQRWHRRLLLEQERVLGEMDRRVEQLAVLDRYDALYEPKQDSRRIWPLMKLHRFAAAQRIADELIRSSNMHTRVSGYNGRLSIEFERERPRACFETALEALRATGDQSCVLALNTAEAAFAVFAFDEVEQLAQKSLRAKTQDCPASAHQHLVTLFLLRADFSRAVAALKAARAAGVERRHRQQFEMTLNAHLVRLLYALGQFEQALDLARRVARAPDRMGLTSFSGELMELVHTIEHHAALTGMIARLRERAAARPLLQRVGLQWQLLRLRFAAWRARRRATTLLQRTGVLHGLLRPYLKPLPAWLSPELLPIAGHGVVAAALLRARSRERMKHEVEPYFDALLGEIAYREGEWGRARALARRALAGLPADEVLLRVRVRAWDADAAVRRGEADAAQAGFDAVLERWPTALRVLDIRLPVGRISAEGGALAAAVARVLRRSPRLAPDRALGFAVSVEQRGDELRSCLSGPRGRRYGCGVARFKRGDGEEARIAKAIDVFHDEVFAPQIDLTQHDINSLDGSAVRGHADEVLREVLGQ